jgi:hypothetical protein
MMSTQPKKILQKLLDDEKHHDVQLVATDGHQVGANRSILGAASNMLHALVNEKGNFVESKITTISTGYNVTVLRAVVDFIHLGRLEIKRKSDEMDGADMKPDMQHFQDTLCLLDAANYYELSPLSELVMTRLQTIMEEHPLVSFAVFQLFTATIIEDTLKLKDKALLIIRETIGQIKTSDVSDLDVLSSLSHDVMGKLLKDPSLHATEFHLFQVLRLWIKGGNDERKEAAKILAKEFIKFDKIPPKQLKEEVVPSGIVSAEDLLEACLKQGSRLWKTLDGYDSGLSPLAYYQHRNPWTEQMRFSPRLPNHLPDAPSLIRISGTESKCDQEFRYVRKGVFRGTRDDLADVELSKDKEGEHWQLREEIDPDDEDADEGGQTVVRFVVCEEKTDPCPRPDYVWYLEGTNQEEIEGVKIEYHYD